MQLELRTTAKDVKNMGFGITETLIWTQFDHY